MRETSIQEVPLSISVVTCSDIQSIGALRLQDINGIMPNVEVFEGAISNVISIRGMDSFSNQGFDICCARDLEKGYQSGYCICGHL